MAGKMQPTTKSASPTVRRKKGAPLSRGALK